MTRVMPIRSGTRMARGWHACTFPAEARECTHRNGDRCRSHSRDDRSARSDTGTVESEVEVQRNHKTGADRTLFPGARSSESGEYRSWLVRAAVGRSTLLLAVAANVVVFFFIDRGTSTTDLMLDLGDQPAAAIYSMLGFIYCGIVLAAMLALAEQRANLVQMETFEARHTMAWNSDPGRWRMCVSAWYSEFLAG